MDDLTDFLENALYDPAFVHFDPNSTTDTLQLNERDLTYSSYRPDLAALGAVDGWVLSGLAQDNNDPLSRRDMGLEFLDVSTQLETTVIGSSNRGSRQQNLHKLTNSSDSIVDTHLLIIVQDLSPDIKLANASGNTSAGDPYLRVFLPDGVLRPGDSIFQTLSFERKPKAASVSYTLKFLSGQGTP